MLPHHTAAHTYKGKLYNMQSLAQAQPHARAVHACCIVIVLKFVGEMLSFNSMHWTCKCMNHAAVAAAKPTSQKPIDSAMPSILIRVICQREQLVLGGNDQGRIIIAAARRFGGCLGGGGVVVMHEGGVYN